VVASSVVLYGNWPKTAGVCLVLWCPIGACMAPMGSNFGSKSDEVREKEADRRQAAKSWSVSIIRKRGQYLGTIEAHDAKAAEAAAVAEFDLNNEQRRRLVVQDRE